MTEGRKRDGLRSLATKRLQCPVFRRPWDLEVCNAETTKHTRKIQQRADLALVLWEAVVGVRVYNNNKKRAPPNRSLSPKNTVKTK